MTRVEILRSYIEKINKVENQEKKLNDICFNWNKSNQSDDEILKKIAYMKKKMDLLTIQAENLRKEYNRIQEEDAFKRRVIMNQKGDFKDNEIIAGIKSKVAKRLITSEEADELILAVQNAYHNQPSTENTIRR